MEGEMTGWDPQHHTSKEDQAIQTTWMRRLAVVYAVALLLLVAFVAVNRMFAEPTLGRAADQAPHLAHTPAAISR